MHIAFTGCSHRRDALDVYSVFGVLCTITQRKVTSSTKSSPVSVLESQRGWRVPVFLHNINLPAPSSVMTRIMHPVHKSTRRDSFPPRSLWVTVGVVCVVVLLYVGSNTNQLVGPENAGSNKVGNGESVSPNMVRSSGDGEIVTGRVDDIAYYHCVATTVNEDPTRHLVLLHGAKFTKEDWKTSGILQSFCSIPNLSVSAMDLPVTATHNELIDLLNSLSTNGLVTLPIGGLVTPSASGKCITDWITNGDLSQLPSYVEKWIPVAAGSVAAVPDNELKSLASVVTDESNAFGILAIYGNRDASGKRTTEILKNSAGAVALELEGGHPCYLDSPDDFVAAVASAMGLKQ